MFVFWIADIHVIGPKLDCLGVKRPCQCTVGGHEILLVLPLFCSTDNLMDLVSLSGLVISA